MNKQVELIKAEIKRLKGQLIRGSCSAQVSMETACKDEVYNEVLAFINSLPEEKPSKDLEKEIIRYQREDMDRDTTVGDVARHFAEWGAEHFRESTKKITEEPSDHFVGGSKMGEDLEKGNGIWITKEQFEEIKSAAYEVGKIDQKEQMEERWLKDREGCFWDGVEEGKKAMKEQMMNYVQTKVSAYQEEYDDYYAGLRVAYGNMLKKLKED